MVHIHGNTNNTAIEGAIKNILTKALKVTSK